MKTIWITPESPQPAALPEDCSTGWQPHAFLGLVYEAVQHVDWPAMPSSIPRPATLATLLTCSYASGSYSSLDIEYAAGSESAPRYICANHPPAWTSIRHFRRLNMLPLQNALAILLSMAHPHSAKIDFRCEARLRLQRALQADSIALDF